MSQQKSKKVSITNYQILARLKRLPLVSRLSVNEFIAYVGLQLCNKGNVVGVERAIKIIHQAKLHLKIETNSAIPTSNILQAMVHLVIYKRELLQSFFDNPDLPVWKDESTAPIFDIMQQIAGIYKI